MGKLSNMPAAKEKIFTSRTTTWPAPVLRLLFILLAAMAIGTPTASAKTLCTPPNRTGENSVAAVQLRLAQSSQTADLQREKSLGRYDLALDDTLAAESTAVPEAFAKELQGGGSWMMTQAQFRQYAEGQALIGRTEGQFMTSATRMNQLIEETGGDPVLLGQKLGVQWEPGTQLIRMDASNPLLFNPRLPNASMIGANPSFIPGGFTIGGVPEIVTDQLPWQEVWATPVTSTR